jgi:hypothetical protein
MTWTAPCPLASRRPCPAAVDPAAVEDDEQAGGAEQLVHRTEALRQQRPEAGGLGEREWTALGDEGAQIRSGDVLHREPRLISVRVCSHEGRDERPVHRAQAGHFGQEAGAGVLVEDGGLDDLHGR